MKIESDEYTDCWSWEDSKFWYQIGFVIPSLWRWDDWYYGQDWHDGWYFSIITPWIYFCKEEKY